MHAMLYTNLGNVFRRPDQKHQNKLNAETKCGKPRTVKCFVHRHVDEVIGVVRGTLLGAICVTVFGMCVDDSCVEWH